VHVIAHRWAGAPLERERLFDGRLVIHRVALDDVPHGAGLAHGDHLVPAALLGSTAPTQAFAWQAARLAERLVADEGIDVVEAQEWEAPLAFFQLRRAAGLGPSRRPPCVVHIHSPTERIFAANGWDTSVTDFAAVAALEAYSITRADAVLCPSRFIADEVIARYALEASRVTVVPYPRGATAVIEREDEVWAAGGVCHVGRLEPRKGVLEWAQAIARVAPMHPQARFDFVGGDTPLDAAGGRTVGAAMRAHVPRHLRRHLHFHGTHDAAGVAARLARASMSVVPSRWENFPYSCIEAMSTGLPVIASPHGGMRELVEDGVSGWIAADGTPDGLAAPLTRALATPPGVRRAMGAAAAATVQRVCDGPAIVARHLAFKRALAGAGVIAVAPPSPAVVEVVVCAAGASARQVDDTLASLRAAGVPDASVQVVSLEGRDRASAPAPATTPSGPGEAESAVMRAAADRPGLGPVAFVDAGLRVTPPALATLAALLAHDPRLGAVAGWTVRIRPGARVDVAPWPSQPHLDDAETVAPLVVVRRAALTGQAGSRRALGDRLLADGWEGAVCPAVLGTSAAASAPVPLSARRFSSMALAIQRLHTPLLRWLRTCAPQARRRFLRDALGHPLRSADWVVQRLRGASGRRERARAGASR
jgi:glycogen(starch) synthase